MEVGFAVTVAEWVRRSVVGIECWHVHLLARAPVVVEEGWGCSWG